MIFGKTWKVWGEGFSRYTKNIFKYISTETEHEEGKTFDAHDRDLLTFQNSVNN